MAQATDRPPSLTRSHRNGGQIPQATGPFRAVGSVLVWLWVAFNLFLLAWVVVASLKDSTEIFSRAKAFHLPTTPHWENFASAWNDSSLGTAFLNTVFVVAVASIVVVVLAAPAAYAMSRFQTRSASAMTSMFAIGMGIPLQATIIPLFIMFQGIGLTDSLDGLILLYIGVQMPFTVFVLTGFFRSLPFELEEAAAIDGASVLRTFRDIMLPLARPGIITALTLNIVFLWNETTAVLYLVTDDTKFTLGRSLLNLASVATYTSDWGALFAGAVIVVLPIVLAYVLLGRRIVEGMTLGAGK